MRTPIIAGNWKMHKTVAEALELVKGIHYGLSWSGNAEIVVGPPLTALHTVAGFCQDSYLKVTAQNLFWEPSGAYTGEVSAPMLREAGAEYVIIGHSERRQYFGETNATVNMKINAALAGNLIPIVCIGETLEQREADQVSVIITAQIQEGLANLTADQVSGLVLAYEPIWAIGTGKTATPEQAEEVHAMIRQQIADLFGAEAAAQIRILYGGSVKPANSKELLALPNVDGALIGGASLKADDFIAIIRSL